ncbi:hypothetical protein MHYP_G00337790 [Metynnis hypsauchen]
MAADITLTRAADSVDEESRQAIQTSSGFLQRLHRLRDCSEDSPSRSVLLCWDSDLLQLQSLNNNWLGGLSSRGRSGVAL